MFSSSDKKVDKRWLNFFVWATVLELCPEKYIVIGYTRTVWSAFKVGVFTLKTYYRLLPK